MSVSDRASFDFIRYASVWEDADVLCDALAPVASGGRLLSIASAGDNALALLTLDPAEVVAVDLNPVQLAALELRRVAFRRLTDDADLLAFLGVRPSADRAATYARLRSELPDGARAFWDRQPAFIAEGIVHVGKFERYLRGFRRFVMPLVESDRMIQSLREPRSLPEQRAFYDEQWDNWRWRALFKLFFSRAVMGRLGRDPAFFTHVEGSVGERILARSRHAVTEIPVRSNPYLAYIMTGTFPPEALPRYLRPEFTGLIRERLDRVTTVQGAVESADGPFDGFNLSDLFEYLSPAEHERVYAALVERSRPGARLVYWNLLAERSRPEALADRVTPLDELAARLHFGDKAWFYTALHVDQVNR